MRRIAAALGLAALAIASAIAIGAGHDTSGYRVDAIFDNASNVIPGQDVKIAGARAGRIVAVELTPARQARVKMEISEQFAPFRTDADCSVQPQSLIGEKFVQCTPGTPRGRRLVGRRGEAPTVPVARTHAPVDLDLVFATFRLPYSQRLAVILNELGTGLAGRGAGLNDTIRRANPAIGQARRTLAILDRDRARLGALVDESDTIIGRLAGRRDRVGDFLDRAAAVSATTASRSSGLRRTIAGLPPLLTEAKPTFDQLAAFAGTARPVVAGLQRSSPQLQRLVSDLGPLADAARPALGRLGGMADTGRSAVRDARDPVNLLRTFARAARPTGALVNELFQSLRLRGVVEGLQTFTYFGATATSRFDRYSHILPAHLIGVQCGFYAEKPVDGCSAQFKPTTAKPTSSDRARTPGPGTPPGDVSGPTQSGPAGRGPSGEVPVATPSPPPSSTVPPLSLPPLPDAPLPPVKLPGGDDQTGQTLLDYLLGNGK